MKAIFLKPRKGFDRTSLSYFSRARNFEFKIAGFSHNLPKASKPAATSDSRPMGGCRVGFTELFNRWTQVIVSRLKTPFRYGLWTIVYGLLAIHAASAQTNGPITLSSPGTTGTYISNRSITLSPGFTSTVPFSASIQAIDCIPGTASPTLTQNYVITSSPRIAGLLSESQLAGQGTCNLMQSVQYVDGLGRPVQTIQVMASPFGYDMVQPQAYDQYGREVTKYLPYTPSSGTPGAYRPYAVSADQGAFYNRPPAGVTAMANPYSQTSFDNSPLDRPIEQGAPGTDWQLGSHTVKMVYTLNNATAFSSDSVNGRQAARYYTTIGSNGSQTLVANSYYPASSLTVTVSKDENWTAGRAGTVEEYKDIDGHVVLKRVYNYASGTVQQLSTYYVYDDLGRLAFVLPPAAYADSAITISAAKLKNLCYQYQYDERGRLIQKKIPGKGWEYTVYNVMDQPVATQDSLQRAAGQWLFTKYDAQQRAVITGIWNNGGTAVSRASLQTTLTGIATNLYEAAQTTGTGYTNAAWPTANVTATLTTNYYDSYANAPGLPSGYSAPTGASLATRGELVATKTAVLNTLTDTLWAAHYYDSWGRNMKSYQQHYLGGTVNSGNYDAITTTYNFTNVPTAATRQHYTAAGGSSPVVTVANTFAYDHVGRKTQTWEQINSGTNTLLNQIDYNEVGQTTAKHLHSENSGASFLQNIGYAYNERGWLRTSVASLLNLDLRYNTPNAGTQQYNGNIAELHYTGLYSSKIFDYTYDKINRLTYANSNSGGLDETITYDLMGNITSLTRGGASAATLAYNYINSGNPTNQLQSVTNSGSAYRSYGYDGNGNATSDGGTKTISYNLLNLPQSLTQSGSTIATYVYDATGQKLRTTSVADSTWDYISGIVYRNGTIAYLTTEEGRAINESGNYAYQYDLKDNLGNNRVVFDKNPTTGAARELQEDEYYAFGLRSNLFGSNNSNRDLYNGKEIQADLTNQYDYGARFYDPVIARWTTVDPLAEINRRYSPFAYVLNNPIRFIDPDGMTEEDDLLNMKDHEYQDNVDKHIQEDSPENTQQAVANATSAALDFAGVGEQDNDDDQCCKTIGPPKKRPKPEKVADKEPESKGEKTAEIVEKVGNVAGYTGVVLDVTKDAAQARKVMKLAKIANVGGVTTILIGTAADLYLTTHNDPKTGRPYLSHAMAATNLGVTVVAVGIGGTGGILVEVGYILIKANMNMDEKHPELIHNNPFRGFFY